MGHNSDPTPITLLLVFVSLFPALQRMLCCVFDTTKGVQNSFFCSIKACTRRHMHVHEGNTNMDRHMDRHTASCSP